jgi:hypothetical protein
MYRLVSLLLILPSVACVPVAEIPSWLDGIAFQRIGGTLFSNPDQLTMKEIHLDNGSLAGREIIVEGQVAEMSEYYTFMVLSDDTARMLVVMTDLDQAAPALHAETPSVVRVLGVVESGKKGLPLIRAKSFSIVRDPAAAAPAET